MKKPYISGYEKLSLFTKSNNRENNTSYFTEAVENSDPDELHVLGGTIKTASIENSDPDELYISGSSILTKSIEDSDPDE